ncbi:MAG: hypothetical protein V4493_01850 [Pseudomonadota bacterium]
MVCTRKEVARVNAALKRAAEALATVYFVSHQGYVEVPLFSPVASDVN